MNCCFSLICHINCSLPKWNAVQYHSLFHVSQPDTLRLRCGVRHGVSDSLSQNVLCCSQWTLKSLLSYQEAKGHSCIITVTTLPHQTVAHRLQTMSKIYLLYLVSEYSFRVQYSASHIVGSKLNLGLMTMRMKQ